MEAKPFALMAVAAVLGGSVALGGAAALGAFDDSTQTTVVQGAAVTQGTVPAADGGALSVNEIYKTSGPGVVQITSTLGASAQDQFQQGSQALGSGFVLDKEGHIVTNFHVVDGATSIEVRFSNEDTMKATLVGSDPSTDVALLKVNASASALDAADARRLEPRRGG